MVKNLFVFFLSIFFNPKSAFTKVKGSIFLQVQAKLRISSLICYEEYFQVKLTLLTLLLKYQ